MNRFYPKLFEPLTIGGVTFRNRLWGTPIMMSSMDNNGCPTYDMIAFFAEKAKGGAATVTLGMTPVDRVGAAVSCHSFNISEQSLQYLAEIAMAIHEHGAKANHELCHGGQVANPAYNNGHDAIGPTEHIRESGIHVRAMTEADMDEVAEHFADAAALLKKAKYDMCLIHGGHGWLLDQFMSPLYNRRTDRYGGSLENRARFPLMVVDRVRERVGTDFLIEYRYSCAHAITGGLTKEEGVEFARMIDDKVDIIHVSAALDTTDEQAVITHPTMFLPHGVNIHYAEAVKASGVKSPVLGLGGITDPALAEGILAAGKTDLIGMTRALIADPYLPEKARTGRAEDIRPCLRCLNCLTGMHRGEHFECSVNPSAGHEFRYRNFIQPATRLRKVLVVGGGPTGMTAATQAAKRGHDVTLAEKSDRLGGILRFSERDELKEDLCRLKDWMAQTTEKSGARLLFNTEVTPGFVREGGYDAVVAAVGSSPIVPPIPGLDGPGVLQALEMYDHLDELGRRVAVLGGGLVGCEMALLLAEQGHSVTIIERQPRVANEANWMHREGMMQAFEGEDITILCGHTVTRVEPGRVIALDADGVEQVVGCDSIVHALGMRANAQTVEQLVDSAETVVAAGDSVRARTVAQATREGFWAAVDLA